MRVWMDTTHPVRVRGKPGAPLEALVCRELELRVGPGGIKADDEDFPVGQLKEYSSVTDDN
ncbi:hypothetical protein IMZ48_35530 [Candidatus Bathyarchaeota archaeon]|nr:hypothetical protein [Candidatus Bathyarchaeota archaeon]